jgi:hypothetical protein
MAAVSSIIAAAALAVTVASVAYSVIQAKKARAKAKKAAEAAAEARRGFETVLENEIVALPIVYGRAKIGGLRAWITTASSLTIEASNAQRMIGSASGSVFTGPLGTVIANNFTGSKNEYLVYQQALCQGPINQVYDIIFNDSYFYNDSQFLKLFVECHMDGGVNNNVSRNFSERKDAAFTGVAYINLFAKINRDNPADLPEAQCLIEGRKVRTITLSGATYSVNNTRVYTTNPAYCLLDYLLEDAVVIRNISTKALSVNEIDLKSFYDAAQVCSRIVQTNVKVTGKIWKPTDGLRNISTRNLPLYECNVILDTAKPIRDNIENILDTMGDARLIWSGGKYHLSLQYPGG